jgi:hypothetical protein
LLKNILFALLTAGAALRLADLIYLVAADRTDLPLTVLISAGLLVFYALILISKRLLGGNVTLRQYMAYFFVHAVAVIFNLLYTAAVSPLRVSVAEMLALGTLFDVLVDAAAIYFGLKQIRSNYLAVIENKNK